MIKGKIDILFSGTGDGQINGLLGDTSAKQAQGAK
jgi:hypothetical protein